ncbi:TIGR03618 family F420-dependent PPOX class oxidoreductase [Solirubrobacter soli]|uniref:TIGR03618 family F420-dependent PPOX class oxidoreductase n=1 Tax=Solirubrobacter soli TaxID=363832 RepID=UPI0004027556|nr:TIGR03618 family F420-dependent PPOX class oxidoreductase [Solirubrobacter soli]
MADLPEEVRDLLAGANIAHIATLLPDGSPHSVAVWAGVHGPHAYFFTQDRSRKARNLARDPRLAISLVDSSNPYRTGWLRGRVVETVKGEEALVLIDELSMKYVGMPFPMRSGTVFLVEAEKAGGQTLPFKAP